MQRASFSSTSILVLLSLALILATAAVLSLLTLRGSGHAGAVVVQGHLGQVWAASWFSHWLLRLGRKSELSLKEK